MFDKQTRTIASNLTLLVVSRVSMALSLPVLGLIAWLAGEWLDNKFEVQDSKIAAQTTASINQDRITTARIETVERTAASKLESAEKATQTALQQASQINDRLIAVETKQTQDSAASERFQNATLQRLDRMQDSIVAMSNAISALTATLQAERENDRP